VAKRYQHLVFFTRMLSGRQSVLKASVLVRPFVSSYGIRALHTSRSFASIASTQKALKESVGQQHILTLLHKTSSFLPCVLAPKESGSVSTESLEFWSDVLASVYDLSSETERTARVAGMHFQYPVFIQVLNLNFSLWGRWMVRQPRTHYCTSRGTFCIRRCPERCFAN
jgi:hypothetical protein